jgi:hypothetical protein
VCVSCQLIDPNCASCTAWSGGARCDVCATGFYFDLNGICQKCVTGLQNCDVCTLGADLTAQCKVCLPGYISSSGRCLQLLPNASSHLAFGYAAAALLMLLLALF